MSANTRGIIASLVCCLPFASACFLVPDPYCAPIAHPADQTGRATISQGITGNVWLWEGDFTGFSTWCPPPAAVTPVERTLLVYQPALTAVPGVSLTSVAPAGSAIDSIRSDSTGFFQLALPPGTYSIVVREGLQYFFGVASSHAGLVGAVDVAGAVVTKKPIDVNFGAIF